ncbi:hypothetical protein [Streptomyces sp. NBC_00568]|nr:hypothetical protein [Streptomyces sp. NBC_00568]MCX4993678.1 hypothetical protein [Streptomyces sp. NBC_00568]
MSFERGGALCSGRVARDCLWLTLRIVSRPKGTKGFVVGPR